MDVKKNDFTSLDFFKKLEEMYKAFLKVSYRNSQEIIEFCEHNYGLLKVTENYMDFIGKSQLKAFINTYKIKDESKIEIYEVLKNADTQLFYNKYSESFDENFKIYIFYDITSEKLTSTEPLLDTKLIIIRGITEDDILTQSIAYHDYLNALYNYDWYLKS